jgi:hypothetical protein
VVFTARLTVLGSLNTDISVTVPEPPVPGATVPGSVRVLNLAPAPSRAEAAEFVAVGPDWLVVNESEAAARPGTQSGMPRPADVGDVTGHRWPVTAR